MEPNGYSRRPSLAGNVIPRTTYATIRGSVRRREPDGTLGVPYFDLGMTNATLSIGVVDPIGVPTTVTFPDRYTSMQAVLDIINGALAGTGQAYDLDGVLHLRSSVRGGTSYISVNGGSAAAALGFDALTELVQAYGGEIAAAPQGRTGNPSSAAFPVDGENLSTESFVRALSRLSGNMDSLYATLARPTPYQRQVSTLDYAQQTIVGNVGTIPLSVRLFLLEDSSFSLSSFDTPEGLAGAFFLLDGNTQQPSASRVVGLKREGADAYGTRPVLQTTAISTIREGRLVVGNPGDFANAWEGNHVEITNDDSLANTVPWDHRGWWEIESISSDYSSISLRPQSPGQMRSRGKEIRPQPVLELNEYLETGKTYGSMTIYDYPSMTGVSVEVSPPLPQGMWVNLYGPNVTTALTRPGTEGYNVPANRVLVSTESPLPDAVLTASIASVNGTSIEYTEFYARKNGRRVRIPAGAVSAVAVPTNSTPYALIWSTVSAGAELRAVTGLLDTDLTIARVWNDGTLQVGRAFRSDPIDKLAHHYPVVIHVGPDQECRDIYEAVTFIRTMAAGAGGWPVAGATFVLHATQVLATTVDIVGPGYLRVQGASGIEMLRPTAPGMALFSGGQFVVEVAVDESVTTSWRMIPANAGMSYTWRYPMANVDESYVVEWSRGINLMYRVTHTGAGLKIEGYGAMARPLPAASTVNTIDADEITHAEGVGAGISSASLRAAALRLVTPPGTVADLTHADIVALVYGGDVTGARHHHDMRYLADNPSGTYPYALGLRAPGTSTKLARQDHVHAHGNQGLSGSLHEAATQAVAGFMSAGDKIKMDTEAFTNLVHKTGVEDISGVKTFTSTPVLPIAFPTLTTQASNRGYVDDLAHHPIWPVQEAYSAATAKYLNWLPAQLVAPYPGPNVGGRSFLLGTQVGVPADYTGRAQAGVTPVVPWEIPYNLPRAKSGGSCRFILKIRLRLTNANGAVQAWVNGQLLTSANAAGCVYTADFTDPEHNIIGTWREYFQLYGGLGGSGAVGAGEAGTRSALATVAAAGGGTWVVSYEWDAAPNSMNTIAVQGWMVNRYGQAEYGYMTTDVTLGAYDPTPLPYNPGSDVYGLSVAAF